MSDRTPAGDKGTADRIEADDGAYWFRLVTWQALDREGACMKHCVGDGDYDRLVGGEDLADNAIWSLRDRDGLSILTVRILFCGVDYAKGPDNHAPGRGASMQVRHLMAAFKAAGHALDVCSTTDIVLLEDGRTFRRDRLPPEVQAQREAVQPAVRDRGIDESRYRNDRWHRANVGTRYAGSPRHPMVDSWSTMAGGHDVFSLTADEPDPVVRVWTTFDTGCHTFVTRSGIRFTVPNDVFATAEGRAQVTLARYHAAIARGAAAPPSGDQPGEVAALPSAGPGGPARLVVEFIGGGMSGAHPGGGGGGRRSVVDYERSIQHSLEHAVFLGLQAQIVGPGAFDPVGTTFTMIPMSEAIEAAPHLPPADTYLPMFEEGPANGGSGDRIESLGQASVLGWSTTLG